MELALNPRLQKSPKFRAAGSSEWQDVDWDWAMDWFARKFKDSRDSTFVEKDESGRTVNRCDGITRPNAIGSDAQRFYELSDNQLILKPPAATVDVRTVQSKLFWERLGG